MAAGGSRAVQLVPRDHVGAAAGEKSHSRPVSETPLDLLLALTCSTPSGLADMGLGQLLDEQQSGAGITSTAL